MKKNSLWKRDETILRVLEIQDGRMLVIDCTRCTMPVWKDGGELQGYEPCTEEMLREQTGIVLCKMEELDADRKKTAYERFTWIAGSCRFLRRRGNAAG